MSEMVEMVARALWLDRFPDEPWEDVSSTYRMTYEGHARAAIEAMREPTKAMCRAVYNPGDEYGGDKMTELSAEVLWETMIDAALKD